jgi:O-antigen/teichoic acid export membrane protein
MTYAACQLGMLSIVAKFGDAVQVGQFALALAVATPIVAFSMLQLRSLQITDTHNRTKFGEYFGLRLLAMFAALVGIVIIAAAGYSGETKYAIISVGVAKIVEAISDIAFGLLQRHERMRRVAVSQIAKGLLAMIFLALCMLLGGNVVWCGVALAIAWSLTLLFLDLPAVHESLGGRLSELRPIFDLPRLKRLATLGLPLGIVRAVLALITSLPRLFLARAGTLADVGVFAAMVSLTLPGTLIIGALGQAVSPRLALAFSQQDRVELRRLLGSMGILAISVGLGGVAFVWLWGDFILQLLFSEQIAREAVYLPMIMVAGGLWGLTSVLGYAATAANRIRWQPVATGVCLVVTLAATWWLVPSYGLSGAAVSSLLSSVSILPPFLLLFLMRVAPDAR